MVSTAWVCAVIEGRLHAPDFACGSPQIGEIQRLNCRAPYRCCCPPPRREDECNEFGSPLSKASPVLSLGTTVSQAPTPQSSDTPYEVAPPTPGTDVKKDPDQPGSKTPRRTEPKTDGSPPDQEKKPGSSAEHYTAGCEIAPSTSCASAEVEKWHAAGAAVGGRSGDVMEHEASGRDFRTINSSHARPRRSR